VLVHLPYKGNLGLHGDLPGSNAAHANACHSG
jgi:hypothetical protein